MKGYSVKRLAKLAGVSVRTLHLYDQNGLLKPETRTSAGYRLYGEKELLRLQQILFYKELDFPLQEIKNILDNPSFNLIKALESHKEALAARRSRITTLLATIDKTILNLKGNTMLSHEELYKGLPKEQAKTYRKEAIEKYGQEQIEHSENSLRSLGKDGFEELKAESGEIWLTLFSLREQSPESDEVQEQIARHYNSIRKFWGTQFLEDKQADAYEGLGNLYLQDERFTTIEGKSQPEFAAFLNKAMSFYARSSLK